MKRITILGSTGMLGSAVSEYFNKNTTNNIISSYRTDDIIESGNRFYFDAVESDLNDIPECDYMINCIGVIKPFMGINKINSIYVNSIFPHKLSRYCQQKNIKLVHITTDCVFSGKLGKYDEQSPHDCEDDYGKSKSLGEPNNCMVLRTSIIGEEVHKNASLIEWVKNNKGGNINGFVNHTWNGITTKHYAEICNQIIEKELYDNGLFHLHSNDVTKLELLHLIDDRFDLNITINPTKTPIVDRTLRSQKTLINKVNIKTIQQQVREL